MKFRKDKPAAELTNREVVLRTAEKLVMRDRNCTYGPPTQDFDRTAAIWNAMGVTFNGEPLRGHHVAMLQIGLKLSRLTWSELHQDSWIDVAGYSACGYECVAYEQDDSND